MTALRKLLVVDDDPVVSASFNRVLSGKGYIVVSAENGYDALERLRAEKFDAVFTDLRMPGMDGLQVAEKVRAAQPWMPVVMVTGYGSPASELRARAAGVSDFLQKPLSPDMIRDSADKAVRTVPEGVSAPQVEIAQVTVETAVVAAPVAAAVQAEPAASNRALTLLKNMGLFLVAPFIGLLYAVLLPFVGLGMLAWMATEGLRRPAAKAQREEPVAAAPVAQVIVPAAPAVAGAEQAATPMRVRDAALIAVKLIAAPFIGLALIVVMPFAGLAMLAWMGFKAAFIRTA